MYLHEDKGLFFDVVNAASEKLNIPMAVIEKDYYVTMILKLLSSKSENCVFKGGTSLSKCFHLLDRFSEDIDITFTEHLGEGRRKTLKYKILRPISEELGLPISNWEKIESDKDYNCYIFAYDPLDGYVEESLYPGVKLETALGSYSFPTELRVVTSYVYEFLKEEDVELVEEFALQPFTMRLQSVVRTFVDKVFALCDYYMEGKSERYSRHLYDLYKLRPVITFDENFATLVKEVRAHRAAMKQTCPSSKPGIDVPEVIRAFCKNGFFSEDYFKITSYFINAPVAYEDTIKNLLEIAESGYFEE